MTQTTVQENQREQTLRASLRELHRIPPTPAKVWDHLTAIMRPNPQQHLRNTIPPLPRAGLAQPISYSSWLLDFGLQKDVQQQIYP